MHQSKCRFSHLSTGSLFFPAADAEDLVHTAASGLTLEENAVGRGAVTPDQIVAFKTLPARGIYVAEVTGETKAEGKTEATWKTEVTGETDAVGEIGSKGKTEGGAEAIGEAVTPLKTGTTNETKATGKIEDERVTEVRGKREVKEKIEATGETETYNNYARTPIHEVLNKGQGYASHSQHTSPGDENHITECCADISPASNNSSEILTKDVPFLKTKNTTVYEKEVSEEQFSTNRKWATDTVPSASSSEAHSNISVRYSDKPFSLYVPPVPLPSTEDPVHTRPPLSPTGDYVSVSPLTPTADSISVSSPVNPTENPVLVSVSVFPLIPTDNPTAVSSPLIPSRDPFSDFLLLTSTEVSSPLTATDAKAPASSSIPTDYHTPASPALTSTEHPVFVSYPATPTLTPTEDSFLSTPPVTSADHHTSTSPPLTPTDAPIPVPSLLTPNYPRKCPAFLGPHLYIGVRDADSRLPKPCWHLLCSDPNPYSFYSKTENITTYWFLDKNLECFEQLNPVGLQDEVFSKSLVITLKIQVIVLNPICVQSRGFAYIQTFHREFSSILPACQKSLCFSGSTVLSYTKLNTILVGPEPLYDNEFADDCLSELQIKAQNGSFISSDQEVYYMSEYPESSPCPMAVIIKTFTSGTRVVIPFRSSWCGAVDLNTWYEILISIYSSNQTDRRRQLSGCLLQKSKKWKYEFNRYIALMEDLLGEDLELPEFSDACLTFICNPDVEFTVIIVKKEAERKMWFPYISLCSSKCSEVKEDVMLCQKALSGAENQAQQSKPLLADLAIPLSQKGTGLPVALAHSLLWSCPAGGGGDEFGRLRAEILFSLWTAANSIPESCVSLVCTGSVDKFHRSIYRVLVNDRDGVNASVFRSCSQQVSEGRYNTTGDVAVLTVIVSKTEETVVFLYARCPLNDATADFLSLAYSVGNTETIKYCGDFSQLYRISYNGIVYYMCRCNKNTSMALENTYHIWHKVIITKNYYLLVFKNDARYTRYMYFLRWLAIFNIQLSDASQIYIQQLPLYTSHFWRTSVIFSFQQYSLHQKFTEFISNLESAHLLCRKSSQFTLCHRTNNHFPDTLRTTAYLLFIHSCSVSIMDKDKIILLLLAAFRSTRVGADSLCRRERVVAMVEAAAQHITFVTRGARDHLTPVLRSLRVAFPQSMWQEGGVGNQWTLLQLGVCLKLKDISNFLQLLKSSECVSYARNGSTVIFQSGDAVSYHAVIFPLKHARRVSTNQDPSVSMGNDTEGFEIVPLRPTLIFSSSYLYITKLMENPTPQYLLDMPQTEKISTAQVNAKTIFRATLYSNMQCLRDIREGKFQIFRSEAKLVIGPIHDDLIESSCFFSLPKDIIDVMQINLANNRTTINKFWPSCLHNMVISLFGRDQPLDWSYLDYGCKANEIALLAVAVTITAVTVLGNVFVLAVILATGLVQEATFLLRASLAVADLLLGAMPAALAVHDSILIMRGGLSLRDLSPDTIHVNFSQLSVRQPPGFQQLRFERHGYPMACSVVFNVSCIVSLLSLALMSVERLSVVLGRPLNRRFVSTGVGVSWLVGVALSLLINWRQRRGLSFVGYFDPITKLTISMGAGAPSVSFFAFYLVVSILSVAGALTVMLIVATLAALHRSNRIAKNKLSIHSAVRDEEMLRLTRTLLHMVLLFGLSSVPVAVDALADLARSRPVAHFFAWWLFVAGASWNWALYSLSGGKFRKHVIQLLARLHGKGRGGRNVAKYGTR